MCKTIGLKENERILCAVPEYVCGPGWSNALTTVYIISHENKIRTEFIQPDERSNKLRTLFSVGAVVFSSLINAIPTKRIK